MIGKIIKGVGGFYYVHVTDEEVYACRARGIFRKDKQKPLVGDRVEISITCLADMEGSIDRILPRNNQMIRPACANIDQVILMFAAADPEPNFNLIDRFLLSMRKAGIPVTLIFNKSDLADPEKLEAYRDIYRDCGAELLFTCVSRQEGIERVRQCMDGKTSILAGPSGVGKSSLTNLLSGAQQMEVGQISRKIGRGRHTTRHTPLIWVWENTYLMDTPGFSTLYLEDIVYEELPSLYREFEPCESTCRFPGCMHLAEPDCGVKQAVDKGDISSVRYNNYVLIAKELGERRKY